jgi:hypothetical protein
MSDFFLLPDQNAEFSGFVNEIVAEGGGDVAENGLEAIALAMKSPWTTEGAKRRHVIVVWTDAPAHPLEKSRRAAVERYPSDLPADLDELTDLWEGQTMSMAAKRLILFAPDGYGWTEIGNHWSNVVQFVSNAGEGLKEIDYGTILDTVAQSV